MSVVVRSFMRRLLAVRESIAAYLALRLVVLGIVDGQTAAQTGRGAAAPTLSGRRLAERNARVAAAIDFRADDRLDEAAWLMSEGRTARRNGPIRHHRNGWGVLYRDGGRGRPALVAHRSTRPSSAGEPLSLAASDRRISRRFGQGVRSSSRRL